MKENDSMDIQRIGQINAQFPFETKLRTRLFKLATMIIPMLDPMGIEITLVFRTTNLGHV